MIQQKVKFYSSFGGAELRPIENRRAQIDDGRIQTQPFAWKSQFGTRLGDSQALLAIGQ